MRKLFPYLKRFKKELILGPLFKLIEAVFELLVPLIMANVIDMGITGANREYIVKMGWLMVLLSAIGLSCTLVTQWFAARASQGFGAVLRSEIFKKIGSFSHAKIDKYGASSIVTRLTSDVNRLQLGVAMFIRLATRAPFLVIGATVMAMGMNFKMSLIFIITAVAISLTLYYLMSRSVPFFSAIQKLLDRVGLLIRENLSGARVIRAFSRQDGENQRFSQAADDVMQTALRVGRLSALLNPATFLIVNAAILAILWFGAGNVDLGVLEQGQVYAMVNYMMQIMVALVVVANLAVIFSQAQASGVRVAELLDEPQDMAEGAGVTPVPAEKIIEFDNVCFSYPDSTEYALKDINIAIRRGQTVGIIGGTGSGKSTIVSLIMRFYDATRGKVYIDGEDIRDYKFEQLRNKIGLVPQKAQLFHGTLRDNMRWGDGNATDGQIIRALKVAQAWEFVQKWPDELNHIIERGGRNLSGGQRQRLTIARALVGDPEILILDDSASALDFATDAALRKALREYSKGVTVIMISQRASTLKNADNIIVLDDGEISGIGTHEQLFETDEIYTEICLSQMEGSAKP